MSVAESDSVVFEGECFVTSGLLRAARGQVVGGETSPGDFPLGMLVGRLLVEGWFVVLPCLHVFISCAC